MDRTATAPDLPHRVRRLRWQAGAADLPGALALRRELVGSADGVQALLARVLDRLAPGREVVHLRSLRVQMVLGPGDALSSALEPALERALREALPARVGVHDRLVGETRVVDRPVADADADAQAVRLGAEHDHEAAFVDYLLSGQLPWRWAGLGEDVLEPALRGAASRLVEALLQGRWRWPSALADAKAVTQRIGFVLRWLPWVPAPLRRRWIEHHRPAPPLAPPPWPGIIDRQEPTGDALELTALWLAWPAAPAPPADTPAALRQWIGERALRAAPWPAIARALGAEQRSPARAAVPAGPASAPPVPRRLAEPAPDAQTAPGQPVALAGLVLLHPFLPRLLAARGLLDATGRAVPAARLPHACGLLNALAQGEEPAVEFALPLVKLLLGSAPDRALDAALPPPDADDLAEVAALLAAVREHWTALRGSGDEGLRLSFLQRRGLLTRADGNWRLRVQHEAFDVVLATLPWSIGLVRLPWMPEALHVDWSDA